MQNCGKLCGNCVKPLEIKVLFLDLLFTPVENSMKNLLTPFGGKVFFPHFAQKRNK